MCGVVGKFNYATGKPVAEPLLLDMCRVISHRGPDAQGVYVEQAVGLGHRRLSIIDLSENGRQPMCSADGLAWITFNGEVYNFETIRKDLVRAGCRLRGRSDTEVIVNLYRERGDGCLRDLRGMFAFGIWDRERSELFLARDRIGKKPLYYYDDGKTLVFASEIKGILRDPDVRRVVNEESIADYLRYDYVPDPKTIFRNLHKLEPGHWLKCTREGVVTRQYWDVSFRGAADTSLDEAAEELKGLIEESVRIRLVSDVPLGAFLSGGIDSSAVVALMAGMQGKPVTTCTIGFDDQAYDERAYARTVSTAFGTDHHEFLVHQNVAEVLDGLAWHYDEPFADPSSVPTYYVSKITRQKVTVALSGDGGDENFAGYEKYHTDAVENRCRSMLPAFLWRLLSRALGGGAERSGPALLRKARTFARAVASQGSYGFYLTNTRYDDAFWNTLLSDGFKKRLGGYDPSSVTRKHFERAGTEDHISRMLYTDIKTYLPGDILVKVDRMSMAHSLEVRAPLLDHRVVEFAATLPSRLKYRRGEKKIVLRRAFEKVLPPEVLARRKMGFTPPMGGWMREDLKQVVRDLFFHGDCRLASVLNMDQVRRIYESHQARTGEYGEVLWNMLMLEMWFRKHGPEGGN